MFPFVLTVSLNMTEAYFPLFWRLCGKLLQRPLGKGQGHFKCIKSKGQTTSNMFFEVTKVHMFLFVLTVSLNMTEAYFPLFWRLCAHVSVCPHCVLKHDRGLFFIILTSLWKKGCSAPWGRVRGILNALNPKVRQQATCFLRSLRCTCFRLSSLCP